MTADSARDEFCEREDAERRVSPIGIRRRRVFDVRSAPFFAEHRKRNLVLQYLEMLSSNITSAEHHVQLELSPSVRFSRQLIHVVILFIFISILTYTSHQRHSPRTSTRPYSHLSRSIISIAIVGLVLDDLLVINGVTGQAWCTVHQISLQLLLMIVTAIRLVPDISEYQRPSGVVLSFVVLTLLQLFLSLRWSWNSGHSIPKNWTAPVLCTGHIRPQLLILLLHVADLAFAIHSTYTPPYVDGTKSASAIAGSIQEHFCRLNSSLLRLFYFFCTSVLHAFFAPGQFSATLYGGIVVIEFVLEYLITLSHFNFRYDAGIGNGHGPYSPPMDDDLGADARLLNDID